MYNFIDTYIVMNARLVIIVISLSCITCSRNPEKSVNNTPSDTIISVNNTESEINSELLDTAELIKQREPEQPVAKHILTTEDLYRDYDNGNDLSKFFKIEVINKDTFLTHLSTAINYMVFDSSEIVKKNGILKLPLEHNFLTLKDRTDDNEDYREYKYIGQIKCLNMYMVRSAFWEDWAYILYDKKNGREVQSFFGMPYLSVDQQYIMCLEIDSFEGVANISMYGISSDAVTNRKYIDPIIEMFVKSWVPYSEKYPMFWGTDNFFYVPVIYNSNFFDAQNNLYGLDQYIRIAPIAS